MGRAFSPKLNFGNPQPRPLALAGMNRAFGAWNGLQQNFLDKRESRNGGFSLV
jgi:hypothetical protein